MTYRAVQVELEIPREDWFVGAHYNALEVAVSVSLVVVTLTAAMAALASVLVALAVALVPVVVVVSIAAAVTAAVVDTTVVVGGGDVDHTDGCATLVLLHTIFVTFIRTHTSWC